MSPEKRLYTWLPIPYCWNIGYWN